MKLYRRHHSVALGFLAVALGATCGGGGNSPGTPTPTAAPTACSLGAGTYAASCARQTTRSLGARVDAAIDAVITAQPSLFDLTDELDAGQKNYRVPNPRPYIFAVVASLQAAGVCAEADNYNDDRIKVKTTADLHESYNVVTVDYGDGSYVQRAASGYDTSCAPAAFPLEPHPDVPPPDQHCGQPYPPPLDNFAISEHSRFQGVLTLDATPRVRGVDYCFAIGYDNARTFCALRNEGNPERVFCESWRAGRAVDTQRIGPTWTRDGQLCTGRDSGCENSPYNQLQLLVYRSGGTHTYRACSPEGACGQEIVNF
jgi:hypothetical protein